MSESEKPIHFRPTQRNKSACGVSNPEFAAYDPRHCNCLRCKRTKTYKIVMRVKR